MTQEDRNDLKWAQRKRLEFLEHELFSFGRVNRASLSLRTNGSKQQAGLDIAEYLRQAPCNMSYNLGEKAYLITPTFKPLYMNASPHHFLANQIGFCSEHIPTPYRDIDAVIFRTVYSAVVQKTWIQVKYQSMSSEEAKERTVAPHTFTNDGFRWHMRGYDFATHEFRDFVLGRIVSASEVAIDTSEGVPEWRKEADHDWGEFVDVVIEPHPGLTKGQRQIVELDYQMKNGRGYFKVRASHLFYILQQFRLRREDESANPAQQQVVLVNREEIEAYLSR